MWIEMSLMVYRVSYKASLPARGVWIEILLLIDSPFGKYVAPREGSVD